MKRIFIFSLLAVFLTTNYAYATMSAEEIGQTIERAQYQQLTQEEVEELFASLLLIYWNELGVATNEEGIEAQNIYLCTDTMMGLFFMDQLLAQFGPGGVIFRIFMWIAFIPQLIYVCFYIW